MLLYPRAFAGLPLLLTVTGSAIPRAIFPALLSTAFTACLVFIGNERFEVEVVHLWVHPYPFTVFANLVGFALVFRLQVAYSRYWEGIGHVRTMTSKWGDAAMEVLSFDCHAKPSAGEEAGKATLESTRTLFKASLCHHFSLMHALACAHLRREERLRRMPAADIGRGMKHKNSKQRRPIRAQAIVVKSSWMQACRLVGSGHYEEYLCSHPLYVIGGLSEAEHSSLGGFDSEARVSAEFGRVLAVINNRRFHGGMWVDPPAVSRVHQVLSDGMLGFQQACKLEDTPLPFPYAQMVSLVLIIFAVTYPLMAASKASGDRPLFDAPWLACAMTFICVLCYFSLHEVARELEDPFIHPPNEAPLAANQKSFNRRLLAAWESLEDVYAEEEDPAHRAVGLHGIAQTGVPDLAASWESRKNALAPAPGTAGDDESPRRRDTGAHAALDVLAGIELSDDAKVLKDSPTASMVAKNKWRSAAKAVGGMTASQKEKRPRRGSFLGEKVVGVS